MAAFTVDMREDRWSDACNWSEWDLSPLLFPPLRWRCNHRTAAGSLPSLRPADCVLHSSSNGRPTDSGVWRRSTGGNLHLSCAHCGIKPEYRGVKLTRLRQGAAPDCCPLTEVRGWPLFYYAWWPDKEINRGWNGALRSDLQSVVFIIMLHQHHWTAFIPLTVLLKLQSDRFLAALFLLKSQ